MKDSKKDIIGAVIISYEPNINRLEKCISTVDCQVEEVVVVDNASHNIEKIRGLKDKIGFTLIYEEQNCGIAKALNDGMKYLQDKNFTWGLTLDQDTVCPANLINELSKYILKRNIGIICPAVDYEGWTNKANTENGITEITACMTSGSLTRIEAWDKVVGFNEAYFIDFVDNDFCMKLRLWDYKIIRVHSVAISHELGDSGEVKIGPIRLRYSRHLPWRYYYMIRNNYVFIQTYKNHINTSKEYLKLLYIFVNAMLFEKRRGQVLRYCKSGYRDGKMKKMGRVLEK